MSFEADLTAAKDEIDRALTLGWAEAARSVSNVRICGTRKRAVTFASK